MSFGHNSSISIKTNLPSNLCKFKQAYFLLFFVNKIKRTASVYFHKTPFNVAEN